MVLQCPYCESEVDVEDTSGLIQCAHCEKQFSLRIRETVTCPGCGADLTVPPGATVVLCGTCRRRVQVRVLQPWEAPSSTGHAVDEQSSATDETASLHDETSLADGPPDYEEARLQTVKAEFADRYEVLSTIGRGGMGMVFKAKQKQPERVVVLKVMLSGRLASEKYRIRFEREAQAIARLKHPGIVSVYEYGEVHGQPYFSMEYVDGCHVREYVARHKLDKRDICRLMVKISRAVAYAHQRGIIHRDLKPSNILVDGQGNPRLLDFGLARLADDPWIEDGDLTEAGEVMGTPSYMSPEQTMGRTEEIDLRCDVYAIGVLFYELLTGSLPYKIDRTRPLESLRVIRDYVPRRPSSLNPKLDSDLDCIVMKCLEKERELRYQSAVELSEDINRYLQGKPVEARPSTAFYYLRKLLWRRRTLFLPVAAAVLIGMVLNVVFILELIKSQRETTAAYEKTLASNRQILKFVEDLRAIRSTVDSLIAQRRWEEAFEKATFAELYFADRGYSGYADQVRERIATGARAELEKASGLIKALKFKEGRDRIRQMKELAEHLGLKDLSAQADLAERQFAESCWQSLSDYIESGGGSARALEKFLAEVPGTEYDDEARYILQKLMRSIRFAQWPFDAQEARRRQRMTGQVMELAERRTISLDGGASMELVLIPAGEFMMGADSAQPGGAADSLPQHRVRIVDPFYVSATEITNEQFEAATGRLPAAAGESGSEQGANLPAAVSFLEAQDFCRKLSARSGLSVRLPTEAEWEYFSRAGSAAGYGATEAVAELGRYGWYSRNSDGHVHPVAAKEPNAWGLYDVWGNVREWCQDWYDARYYLASPVENPTGPLSGTYKVLRGGSFMDEADGLMPATRAAAGPDSTRPTYGFRICVDVVDGQSELAPGRAVAATFRP